MINGIINISINNKIIVGLFTIIIIISGIWSITNIPIDAVPDITNNQVQIISQNPNLGTEEIEQIITHPIEIEMSNLPNVKEIRSISRFGLSVITVVFDEDIGTYIPRQLVSEKLNTISKKINTKLAEPHIGPISTGLGEIYQYVIKVKPCFSNKYSLTYLRTIQDWIIKRQMSMIDGVVEVNSLGGKIKQYEVHVNPEELNAIGITIEDVFSALEKNNSNSGGAYIEKNYQANFIRGEGLIKTLEDIKKIVVSNKNTIPIKIEDVAKVTFGNATRYGAYTIDGEGETVGGIVLMLKGANSNDVISKVKNRIAKIQKTLPKGISIETVQDRSKLIKKTTTTVSSNLIEGALIVIFVLVLLLGNLRAGLIVASTIPISLLFAFSLMKIFNISANLMSLGAIDFGIIIDGAVIIVESTLVLISKAFLNKNSTKLNYNNISFRASSKMMSTAFFGQLIILIVFIPILSLEGIEGKMFKPMAYTFIFAMIGVMFLCLTYVPMMSSLFLTQSKKNKTHLGNRIIKWLEKKYLNILEKAFKKSKLIVISALIFLGISFVVFKNMGGEFIPQLDEGDIAFHAILKPGTALSETIQTTTKIENLIKNKFPEVIQISSRIGVAEIPTDPMPMDVADVIVILKEKNEWVSANSKDQLIHKIKHELQAITGVNFEFTQPIEMRFNELLEGIREDIAIKIYGENMDILVKKSKKIMEIISGTKGIGDMKAESTIGMPQILIQYNRNKIAQYGVDIKYLNKIVQSSFAGAKAGVIFEGEKRFDLVVKVDPKYVKNIEEIKNIYFKTPSGSQIPLKEFAEISYKKGLLQVSRDNTQRRIYVGINVRGRDIKTLIDEIKLKIDANLSLPSGYFIEYGGAFKNFERGKQRLQTLIPIALILIFILIFFALKSISQALLIYLSIPMASIGGIFSLWARDMPLSISAGIGFIVLFGVAVLNSLVMISGLNELKKEGVLDITKRIKLGTKRRLRPIILTALTDILGFMPMAISTSAGAEIQKPLATVVIGGLATSTILTLFVIPILYNWVEKKYFIKVFNIIKKPFLSVLLVFIFISTNIYSEKVNKISLKKSLELALENHPKIKQNKLELEKQKKLKGTVIDLGITNIFSSGEEINEKIGVYTRFGISQNNIDFFGIIPKLKIYNSNIFLTESKFKISSLEIKKQVKKAWINCFIIKKNYSKIKKLDSLIKKYKNSINIKYKTKNISISEYLEYKTKLFEIKNLKNKIHTEFLISEQKLNLLLFSDKKYTVADTIDKTLLNSYTEKKLENHPVFEYYKNLEKNATYNINYAKSKILPKINLSFGKQEVNNKDGFYRYQIGVSIPIFSGSYWQQIKNEKYDKLILENNSFFNKKEIQLKVFILEQKKKNLKTSWNFFKDEILPILKKEKNIALLELEQGKINYIQYFETVENLIKTEIEANNVYLNFLQNNIEIQYYK